MLKSTNAGTFLVNILDRQHNSWQGTITWVSGKEQKKFRSVIEFIKLIDDALEAESGQEETASS